MIFRNRSKQTQRQVSADSMDEGVHFSWFFEKLHIVKRRAPEGMAATYQYPPLPDVRETANKLAFEGRPTSQQAYRLLNGLDVNSGALPTGDLDDSLNPLHHAMNGDYLHWKAINEHNHAALRLASNRGREIEAMMFAEPVDGKLKRITHSEAFARHLTPIRPKDKQS